MLTDRRGFPSKQLSYSFLGEPDGFVFDKDFDPHLAVAVGVEEEVGFGGGEVIHWLPLVVGTLRPMLSAAHFGKCSVQRFDSVAIFAASNFTIDIVLYDPGKLCYVTYSKIQ